MLLVEWEKWKHLSANVVRLRSLRRSSASRACLRAIFIPASNSTHPRNGNPTAIPPLSTFCSAPVAADAEIKIRSVESPELTNVLPLKPGVGQDIVKPASSTAPPGFLPCFNFDLKFTDNHSLLFFSDPVPSFNCVSFG